MEKYLHLVTAAIESGGILGKISFCFQGLLSPNTSSWTFICTRIRNPARKVEQAKWRGWGQVGGAAGEMGPKWLFKNVCFSCYSESVHVSVQKLMTKKLRGSTRTKTAKPSKWDFYISIWGSRRHICHTAANSYTMSLTHWLQPGTSGRRARRCIIIISGVKWAFVVICLPHISLDSSTFSRISISKKTKKEENKVCQLWACWTKGKILLQKALYHQHTFSVRYLFF